MTQMIYTIETQREAEDFSDASTTYETTSIQMAVAAMFNNTQGHRRLIAWDVRSGIRHPLELERI